MINCDYKKRRSSFRLSVCLTTYIAVLAMTAQVPIVRATQGGLRHGNQNRHNNNNDNNNNNSERLRGGLSDREEKIALAMEREYYRMHPITYDEAVEDEM